MKKIEAYIQPSKLDDLKSALVKAGISGMSVSEVLGFGRQLGYVADEQRGPEPKLLRKMKLEIVVDEDIVDRIVQLVIDFAQTGHIGAGKVFVLPVEDAVRIGTREVGSAAIH